MTDIKQISVPKNYDFNGILKRIAKKVKFESDIGKKSSIVRDALKLLEKYLYPDTVFTSEGIYVNNDGLIELKSSIDEGNSQHNPKSKLYGILLAIKDFLIDLIERNVITDPKILEDTDFHLKKIEIALGELK